MMTKLCVLTIVAAGAAGCAKTESSDLLTSGIYADLSARATGTGTTTVYATLYVGNPINLNFVELTGDDQLVASYGGQTKVMNQTELLNIVSHAAEFSTDAEGASFGIALQRSVDAGAPTSTVTLPAKFTLTPVPTSASRAAALALSWSPAASTDTMSWRATGECIGDAQGVLAGDSGTMAIAAGTLMKRQGQNIPDSCMVSITVTRSRAGKLDSHYGKGGDATGRQDRTVTMMSTP
jgi:hypothetical protein